MGLLIHGGWMHGVVQDSLLGSSIDLQQVLKTLFDELNAAHFDAFLDAPVLVWNSRLRSCAGRFRPGSRKFFKEYPPRIEIASYLCEEQNGMTLIRDTLGHEMIHYWLWVRRKPYGHTPEFYLKMQAMGVSRYNPVPRTRPFRYIYRCDSCAKEFPTRKKLGPLACAHCCKKYAGGRYDARFQLAFHRAFHSEAAVLD